MESCFKGKVGETSERWVECMHMGFSECTDAILNWTELNRSNAHKRYFLKENSVWLVVTKKKKKLLKNKETTRQQTTGHGHKTIHSSDPRNQQTDHMHTLNILFGVWRRIIDIIDHFYKALFSTLKQTHCACMWVYMSE